MKETEDDINKWEDYTTFLDWKNQYCQNDYTTQGNQQTQCNLQNNGIFHRPRTKNFKTCMEKQKTPKSQSKFEKENWSWRNWAPRLQSLQQSYSHQTTIKTEIHEKRSADQWSRTENLEIKSHTYGQLIYNKGGRTIPWRKDSLLKKRCQENWTTTCKRMKLENSIIPCTKLTQNGLKTQIQDQILI